MTSASNSEDNKLYEKYMKERIIDSAFEKPITINGLYQRIRDELMVLMKQFYTQICSNLILAELVVLCTRLSKLHLLDYTLLKPN